MACYELIKAVNIQHILIETFLFQFDSIQCVQTIFAKQLHQIIRNCIRIIRSSQINGSTAFLCSITKASSFIACVIKVTENQSCVRQKESCFIRNVTYFTLLIQGIIVFRFLKKMARIWITSDLRVKIQEALLDSIKLAQLQAN